MKKRKGFTAVELLTVISIIVLLVSIFLPSLQNVKQRSNPVCCQYNAQNDITFSPIELVLVSLAGIPDRPTTVGRLLVWEQLSENPDPYCSSGLNLLIYDNRCVFNRCRHRHYRTSHICTNPFEDNTKGIFTDFLINKIDQKQSAQ